MRLSWNSGIALLDRASFIKWDNDGTSSAKPRNVNVQLHINGLGGEINTFRIIFKEIIQIYIPKLSMLIKNAIMT